MTADEVAHHIKCHPETVRQLARAQQIPAVKTGRRWLFRLSQIDEWLLAGRPTQTEQPSLFGEAAPGA